MNDLEQAARQALKALERSESAIHKARADLRKALEQPKQEPTVWSDRVLKFCRAIEKRTKGETK